MPLVTAGQRPFFVDDGPAYEALGRTNLDLRRIVLLPPEAQGLISSTQRVAARVVASEFANQRVSIQTEAPAACLVVISQTYYPAWHARVDGQPAKLWRANYAFQAVEVPAGRHRVELAYLDKTFLAGLALSALGLLTGLVLWLLAHFQRSMPGGAPANP